MCTLSHLLYACWGNVPANKVFLVRAVQAEIVFAHTPIYPEEPPLIKARRCAKPMSRFDLRLLSAGPRRHECKHAGAPRAELTAKCIFSNKLHCCWCSRAACSVCNCPHAPVAVV